MDYSPRSIEKKWKKYWDENAVYKVYNDTSKPKYYVLDMFPYPSGAGLHVGHPLGYIASDIFARFKRMKGFNVLHPMGYDAFGLPAEQYAVTMGVHPAVSTNQNIKMFRSQMDNLGFSFDWSRQVNTSDPNYYKWTQWIFLKLYEHYYDNDADKAMPISDLIVKFEGNGTAGVNAATSEDVSFTAEAWQKMSPRERADILMNYRLVYRKESMVNWCEALGTVLANDEVKDGVSERGGHPVVQKPIIQWSMRTTAYAERLLSGLNNVDWPDALRAQQTNWIGRSEGGHMVFDIDGHGDKIKVFTTRPDTVFGATFMVLAPEHELVAKITTNDQKQAIDDYLEYVNSRSELDRISEVKNVTGAFTGAYAVNPMTEENIPIWISEYVLAGYGTGAIMAVPDGDLRDKKFAEHFGLNIIPVVDQTMYPDAGPEDKVGKMINSGFLNGMEVKDAIEATLEEIERKGIGERKINYKLRDANYSRQRYWGEPVPIKYDADGVDSRLPDNELPLELPEMEDFEPGNSTEAPLARNKEWIHSYEGYRLEADTMPGFAGSSWYFMRYMDPNNDEAFASKEAMDYWESVDLYIGGAEHAVGHLMYSRTWHKFLFDIGLVPTDEPFKKLVNQGMIQGVIEHMYLKKEKTDGFSHFICARHAAELNILDKIAKIPVYVDFVNAYGTPDSYMDISSIKRFIEWRPEYKNAIFECSGGVYQKGEYKSHGTANDLHMFTDSEVGKMSKRYFNVVNPDDIVNNYGADCFRMYEMFLGPLEQAKPWDTKGIEGVSKFLRKLWSLFYADGELAVSDEAPTKEEFKVLHTAIKKISTDIERLAFNTCVSAFMVCVNDLKKLNSHKREILDPLTRMLSPFAPHLAEELWQVLGQEASVTTADFPVADESYLKEDSITYPICINGKKRATADFAVDTSKEDMEKASLELEAIQKWIDGKTIRKVIIVPKRMVNIVVG
ncbi:MAG: class I tRNA ligase family protein [Bacteroidota bacterium]